LGRYGVSQSQLDGFFSGQPLSPDEEGVLIRLLYLYPRFGQDNVEAWAKKGLSWDQIAISAEQHRAELFPLSGRVRRVAAKKIPDELASRYEFGQYFEVRLDLDDSPYAAVVYCRQIPGDWPPGEDLNEHAAATGLFLKTGDLSAEPPELLFATWRIAWLPDRPDPNWQIAPDHVALAGAGVDIGQLREVGKEKGPGIHAAERDPFYQVLAALRDERLSRALRPATQPDLVQLLREPRRFQGLAIPVHGIARRVTKIVVPERDIRRRFGIDHYYEIDVTAPLDKPIRIGADPKTKAESLTYETGFPLTLCVLELPTGLNEGDEVRQLVAAEGIFFKLWTYRSPHSSQSGLLQPAPLVLARTARLAAEEPPVAWVSDAVVIGVVLAAVGVFVAVALWYRYSDRGTSRTAAAPARPPPDFSNLR
jgi:hypothetical protein